MANAESRENRSLKLTLRTLLAWLDDQLPTSEVRQIGQKVSESPFAKGLVEKIQKVTRRRRLTVPPSTGPDATDPNLVASYLDNELTPEKVAEYEEKCLKSDVDLAEVASCHQILSMIAQKAKVPHEARFRMYRLVKGREAISREPRHAFTPPPPEPIAKPIPQWTPTGGARLPSFLERYGPPAAVIGLMLLMGVSAWMMFPVDRSAGRAGIDGTGQVGSEPGVIPDRRLLPDPDRLAGLPGQPVLQDGLEAGEALPEFPESGAQDQAIEEESRASESSVPEATVSADVSVTVRSLNDGLLLQQDPVQRTWLTRAQRAAIPMDVPVVAPMFMRPMVSAGPVDVQLVGPAQARWLKPMPGEATRFALELGRVVLRSSEAVRLAISLDGQIATIALPANVLVGVERTNNWPMGASEPSAPNLTIFADQGSVGLESGGVSETLSGPGSVVLRLPVRFVESKSAAPPDWLSSAEVSEADRLTRDEFLAYFSDGISITRSLVEAIEDESPRVRELAVSTLGNLGALDLAIASMTRKDDPELRQAAIRALRSFGARSPIDARTLRDELVRFNGEDWAALVARLLAGFTPQEVAARDTYVELVGLLENPDLAIRQLAIGQLRTLTNRDSLEYDPDLPNGPGLEAWKRLLRRDELHPGGRIEAETAEERVPAPSAIGGP